MKTISEYNGSKNKTMIVAISLLGKLTTNSNKVNTHHKHNRIKTGVSRSGNLLLSHFIYPYS